MTEWTRYPNSGERVIPPEPTWLKCPDCKQPYVRRVEADTCICQRCSWQGSLAHCFEGERRTSKRSG